MSTKLTFLVIGAYKSGTTALNQWLHEHPDVFLPKVKEPSFLAFADCPDPDNPTYKRSIKSKSAYEKLFRNADGYRAVGEVSPEYMLNPNAAESILRRYPNAKLIALLRNPVERAFSDYLMYRRDGLDTEPDFIKALCQQSERRQCGLPTGYYIEAGRYGTQLERYYTRFPKDQILLVSFEDWQNASEQTLGTVLNFLNLSADKQRNRPRIHNRSGTPTNRLQAILLNRRNGPARALGKLLPYRIRCAIRRRLESGLERPQLPLDAKDYLVSELAGEIALLSEVSGIDFTHWLQTTT